MLQPLKSFLSGLLEAVGLMLRRPSRRQVAALCWRRGVKGVEVLTITTRRTGRWVIPRGWPIKGLTSAGAAAQEAWEEAGVKGTVDETSLGSYGYTKNPARTGPERRITVEVFALKVTAQADRFPESKQRTRKWQDQADAAELLTEPGLVSIVAEFTP